MIYIFILIILIVFIIQDGRVANKSGRGHLRIIYWIFVFLAGLRYMIGGDTQNYYQFFCESPSILDLTSSFIESSRFQTGYIIFTSLVKTISNNFVVQQLLHALCVNSVIFFFIKENTKYPFAALLIYFILNYFEFNTEIMRESLAVSIGLLSYHFLKKKKIIFYLICVFFAYSFHISAMVLFLYPLLQMIQYTNRSCNIILIFIIILPFAYRMIPNLNYLISFLTDQDTLIDQYAIQEVNTSLNPKYYIIHLLKYVVLPFFSIKLLHKQPGISKIAGFIYAYVAFQSLGMFSYGFYRMANYFAPFYWILMGTLLTYIINTYTKSEYYKVAIIVVFSSMVLILYQNHQLLVSSTTREKMYKRYLPYQSIIPKKNTYQMN